MRVSLSQHSYTENLNVSMHLVVGDLDQGLRVNQVLRLQGDGQYGEDEAAKHADDEV